MVAGRFILVMLAATTVTTVTTQPASCTPPVAGKAGWVTYTARPGDTPYTLAQRFYGKMWMGYQIADANKLALTREGVFPPGAKLMIPPGLDGRPVAIERGDGNPVRTHERERD
jgi:nucleoid-associated protein YgaU